MESPWVGLLLAVTGLMFAITVVVARWEVVWIIVGAVVVVAGLHWSVNAIHLQERRALTERGDPRAQGADLPWWL